jgi:hypothetical protein
MDIDTEIEEVEEDPMETSDDEFADDETYRMSAVLPSENSTEEDNESNGSGAREEVENEGEEGMAEGTLNPQSHRRDSSDSTPTIRILHMSLWYVVANYKGKGATKKVKKMQKVDPRSQQNDASDYRFHTHFQKDIYETLIIDIRRIVSKAQWVDWQHMQ